MALPPSLPIDEVLPALHDALARTPNVVLEAPPGAGKTTRVPVALLDAPWRGDGRLLMLEPRRLAARAAAHFMARTLGERVGGRVGYRVRGDTQVSAQTRIEVVTEGILTRLLAEDPTLDGIAAVLFDEFHERSIHADCGLALTLESQQHLRPDLRVLVMSATLDGASVAQLLGDGTTPAPVVRSDGRMFPVETRHRPPRPEERVEAAVARVVREALTTDAGDVLVFLPGFAEQRRVAERLQDDPLCTAQRATVHVLHGSLPLGDQDAAIAPAPFGTRKVVLATSIAETSLTIEGVRVVVDSGVSRLPRFDARAGLTRLHTVRVSRASADQRRGRAGRVAPGVCYRVWDAAEDAMLVPRTRPEILEADLSALALALADAGVHDASALRWLDVPPAGAMAQARELLRTLEALDQTGRVTTHGRAMAALPLAPRLAHLLLHARARGHEALGVALVALLEERDVLRAAGHAAGSAAAGAAPTDLRLRVEALWRTAASTETHALHGATLDRDGLRRVRERMRDLTRGRRSDTDAPEVAEASASTGMLLALAFPDRVAQRRPGSGARFLMRSGTGVQLPAGDALADAEWLAVAELEGQPPEYRVSRAAPLTREELVEDFGAQCVTEELIEWHEPSRSVRARRRTALGALALDERAVPVGGDARVTSVLLEVVRRTPVDQWPWGASGKAVRARLACVHVHRPEWPDVSDAALQDTLDTWLAPHLEGVRSWSGLEALDWGALLLDALPWAQRAQLDRLVPTHLEVPSGSRIALDYTDPAAPVLPVKLQEVFGWTTTPLLCDGQVPVTLHLLSPAQRPVQVTRDLAGFWRTSYFEVRKELRGRYPRHPWPEDPLTAVPTRRAKPRGT